jgi:DNA repair exonuclease SbcCD ATPase subunit
MKIIALQSENVKRLRAVSIKPDGSLVVIKGDNGQGKTSVLDSIAYALGGEKLCPPQVIRRGADTAEVTLDLEDFIVTRRWTAAGSSLAVKSREGARYPSPQGILDRLVGKLSFDPLAFTRQPPKEQAETLRRLVGLDFTLIDAERQELYEERTVVNRDVAIIKGAIAHIPEVQAPDEEMKIGELLAEQERRLREQRSNDEKRRVAARITQQRAEAVRLIDIAGGEVRRLEEQLAEARARLADATTHAGKMQAAEADADAVVAALVEPDLDAIRKQLAEAEGVNTKVRAKRARAAELEKLTKKEAASKAISEKIEGLDVRKAASLAQAKFPIAGLSFTDSGVTLDDLPLEQASSAEQLRVSLAVGIALNPKLKVLLIRDGSLLDEKSMRLVAEMAEAAGAQVWLEMVGKSGVPGVVIEDGSVEGAPAARKEKAAGA